jgi:hypothetical protein
MPPELCEVVGPVPRVKEVLALAGGAALGPVVNPPLNLGGMSRRRDQSVAGILTRVSRRDTGGVVIKS